MSKRKMPAHIVLPNGMWRFVKSGTKSAIAKIKEKRSRQVKIKHKRSARVMAKHRKIHSRNSFGGGGKLMNGFIKPHGILAGALLGVGIASLQEKILPQVIPYQSELFALGVGGVPGAVGSYGRKMLSGGTVSSGTVLN